MSTSDDGEIFVNTDNGDEKSQTQQRTSLSCCRSSHDSAGNVSWLCQTVVTVFFVLIFIIVLETMNYIHFEDGFWKRRYTIIGAPWCEATYANRERFILEPANARSDYFFLAVGCWMTVVALFDFFNLWKVASREKKKLRERDETHVDNLPLVINGSDQEIGEIKSNEPSELELASQSYEITNGILRYPHISFVNGIFNILHGLGSFWYHACECETGGNADFAGMVSVISFPIWYTPLQLAIGLTEDNPSTRMQKNHYKHLSTCLSVLPPIGQTLIWILGFYGILKSVALFTMFSVIPIPLVTLYMYYWRNKGAQQLRQQQHTLKYLLIPLGLLLFGLAWGAWKLDKDKIWCFKSWFQGHAVWHILSSGSLVCVYWFYRSEQITYG